MKIMKILILLFLVLLINNPLFADYNAINKDFLKFKQNTEKDFLLYKKIIDEEFNIYKRSILKVWSNAEISSPKIWVEYTEDYRVKRELNFEKEYIKISIVNPTGSEIKDKMLSHLEDMLSETSTTAVKRDQFLRGVEKRLRSSKMDILSSDKVDSAKVIGDAVTGYKNPNSKQIRKSALDLLKRGKVRRYSSKFKGSNIISIEIALPKESLKRKASLYVDTVRDFSNQRSLDPSLVFAVIHTESTFNPMAKSNIPAYGLMQVVPRTAGLDATKLIFGRQVLLAPSYLYNAQNNIRIGVAYLAILSKKYLRSIKNPKSRIYCAIAAYNTGSSNVGRAFINKASMRSAAPVINKMTPEEVYQRLIAKLPQKETRNYLKKVRRRMKYYKTK
ncbi:MAG: transglycosylase SLT domain-containing protein [Desulfobacterales bacterium]|nr:transglycosylase SLT domain-containing protein [Desulfobacterales bacterium]